MFSLGCFPVRPQRGVVVPFVEEEEGRVARDRANIASELDEPSTSATGQDHLPEVTRDGDDDDDDGNTDSTGVVPNNASRRSFTDGSISGRRKGALQVFFTKMARFLFPRRTIPSPAPVPASAFVSQGRRRRERSRRRVLRAGQHLMRHSGEMLRMLQNRDGSHRQMGQEGDVYIYIPYNHLNDVMSHLSDMLPILSLSLSAREGNDTGLSEEDFAKLPKVSDYGDTILDCPVCMNPMDAGCGDLVQLPCFEKHIFHSHCLWKWLASHSTCPLCRETIQSQSQRANEEDRRDDPIPPAMHGDGRGRSLDLVLGGSESESESFRRVLVWRASRNQAPIVLVLSREQH